MATPFSVCPDSLKTTAPYKFITHLVTAHCVANSPKVFLRDSVGQVADVQRRHQFVLRKIELWHAVVASQQLVRDGVVDSEKPILDVLVGQRIVGVRRLLMPSCTHTHNTHG